MIDLYDYEKQLIEDLQRRIVYKWGDNIQATPENILKMNWEILERYKEIGFEVDVHWEPFLLDMAAGKTPTPPVVEIVDRIQKSVLFDHELHRHEIIKSKEK